LITSSEEHELSLYENRVLRTFLEPRGRKARGNFIRSFMVCTLPSIFEKVKSKLVRWVGLVACDGEMRNTVLIWNF
jgi:hypothetical protein